MVAGRRRSQSKYPLNTRHMGKTWKDRSDALRCRNLIILIARVVGFVFVPMRLPLLALALQTRRRLRRIEGWIIISRTPLGSGLVYSPRRRGDPISTRPAPTRECMLKSVWCPCTITQSTPQPRISSTLSFQLYAEPTSGT